MRVSRGRTAGNRQRLRDTRAVSGGWRRRCATGLSRVMPRRWFHDCLTTPSFAAMRSRRPSWPVRMARARRFRNGSGRVHAGLRTGATRSKPCGPPTSWQHSEKLSTSRRISGWSSTGGSSGRSTLRSLADLIACFRPRTSSICKPATSVKRDTRCIGSVIARPIRWDC